MGKITGVKLPTILDDLKWCFDTPASTVVELALKRLGILAFYANLLNDISVHAVRSTIAASGAMVDIAQFVHRQHMARGRALSKDHSTEFLVADITISVAKSSSTQPVVMPTGAGNVLCMDRAWFVDDSTLAQAGANSTTALQRVVESTGLMDYFLGLERRAKKCLWAKVRWPGTVNWYERRGVTASSCWRSVG